MGKPQSFHTHLGVMFCKNRKCPDLTTAPCPPHQKTCQTKLCKRTGFMPGHMHKCPRGYT